MPRKRTQALVFLVLAITPGLQTQALQAATPATPSEPVRLTWDMGEIKREAIVYVPGRIPESGVPTVFGFHGHGGSAEQAARSFRLHEHWPEALTIYMQGIPTPGRLTDPEGKKNGWQQDAGDQDDRDLKFFDAVLKTLKEKYTLNAARIYATGHSNGGAFTYLLWAQRPDVFAAFAPSAAASRSLLKPLPPRPLLHIAGEQDPLVKFAVQQKVMDRVRAINGCADTGTPWAPGCTLYASSREAPFMTFIHSGDHKYPDQAPALIVKFFKENSRKQAKASPAGDAGK